MVHQSVRLSVAALGFTVLAVGLVLLVTPGPGLLVIIAGLAILATEFVWARLLLQRAKRYADKAKEKALGQGGFAGLKNGLKKKVTGRS